ncbi:hypothetical protein ACG02S_07560 [Roseateles sp. DC23W]|uniref:Uncharacterized protein n=1 Tax=Pelomonas dachongensis TaxID=3299029 RepID=A0ABW7ELJ3_9BURK
MNRSLVAGLALAGLTGLSANAAEPSLCTQLADEARKAPAAIWARPDPLAAWIEPGQSAKPSPTVAALANDQHWRDLLAASDAQPIAVRQLEGAPVYMVDDIAGTAHCQSLVLVEAQVGQPARQLQPPFDLERMSLCMTQSAGFARVLGRPALLVGGAPSMTSPDLQYRIALWAGEGWGQRCSITVRRNTEMSMAQRFCPPGSKVCESGQPVAQRLAHAYEAARAANQALDATAFNGGRWPDAAVAAALNPPLAHAGAIGHMNPPFPLFGADEQRLDPMLTVFSNTDPRVLPVQVDSRWWLAVVGRSGVGWREGDAVLVAFFALPGRVADGAASYQFRVSPKGLRDVMAIDEAR